MFLAISLAFDPSNATFTLTSTNTFNSIRLLCSHALNHTPCYSPFLSLSVFCLFRFFVTTPAFHCMEKQPL
jgi:hypothetical protein